MADSADADAAGLRAAALAPGGYAGSAARPRPRGRRDAWLSLLALPQPPPADMPASPAPLAPKCPDTAADAISVSPPHLTSASTKTCGQDLPVHPDERQVELDVRRSFGSGWVADADSPRRRAQLYEVIVSVLRATPSLAYYQGYHDVVSVLLLTLAPHLPLPQGRDACAPPGHTCTRITWKGDSARWVSVHEFAIVMAAANRVTLHFLRDFCAPSFGPSMAHLTVLSAALTAVPDLALVTGEDDGLGPVYALSWLLTFFAHNTDLRSAQRIMDCVLAFGPRIVTWIAVAMLSCRLREIETPLPDSDPAAWHGALQQLPHFVLGDTSGAQPELEPWQPNSQGVRQPQAQPQPEWPVESDAATYTQPAQDVEGTKSKGPHNLAAQADDPMERLNSDASPQLRSRPSSSGYECKGNWESHQTEVEWEHSLRAKPSSLALIQWDDPDETFADPDVSLPDERFLLSALPSPLGPENASLPAGQVGHDVAPRSEPKTSRPSVELDLILRLARDMQVAHDTGNCVAHIVGPHSVLVTWDRILGALPVAANHADAVVSEATTGGATPATAERNPNPVSAGRWAELDAEAVEHLRLIDAGPEPVRPPEMVTKAVHYRFSYVRPWMLAAVLVVMIAILAQLLAQRRAFT